MTVLRAGELPHPTHVHEDEELIIPLAGELDVLLGPDGTDREERMGPGSFRFYASEEPHTLRGVGPEPSRYLIFKWSGFLVERPGALPSRIYDYAPLFERMRSGEPPSSRELVFEGPTENLETLHVHATRLRPGGGYGPHGDPYDVALVLLKGSFETAGQRYDAPSVVFFPADIPHGMANPTDETAEYLAIEFHGPGLKLGDHVH